MDRSAPRTGKNPWLSGGYIVDQFVWRALAADREWMSLYACAVSIQGQAIVIAGPGEVGKTTLALALAEAGAAIYGDEMILIRRRDRAVSAIARRMMIRDGSLPWLKNSALARCIRASAATVSGTGSARIAGFDRSILGPDPTPVPLAALILLERGEGPPVIRPRDVARAANALRPYLGTAAKGFAAFADVTAALSHSRCFSVTAGEPVATARAILESIANDR